MQQTLRTMTPMHLASRASTRAGSSPRTKKQDVERKPTGKQQKKEKEKGAREHQVRWVVAHIVHAVASVRTTPGIFLYASIGLKAGHRRDMGFGLLERGGRQVVVAEVCGSGGVSAQKNVTGCQESNT